MVATLLYSRRGDAAKAIQKATAISQHPDGFSLRTQGARDADLASLAAGSAFGAGRPETRPADGPGRLNVREPESPDGLGRLSH